MTHEHMNRVSVMYFELRNGSFQMQSDYGTFCGHMIQRPRTRSYHFGATFNDPLFTTIRCRPNGQHGESFVK